MEKAAMKHINQRTLTELAVPAVITEHQAKLRQALFAAAPSNTNNKLSKWGMFMTKKKFILSGATVGLVAVTVLAVSLFGGQSQAAYAEQLTSQSLQDFSKLPPDAQQSLDSRINANAASELQAAENAPDLKVLTYDQIKQLTPRAAMLTAQDPNAPGPGPVSLDLQSLKYLSYTDDQGATHVIGVDSQGLPAIIMVFQDNGDMHSGSVQVMGGA
jgi:hypothetical protein